MNKQLVSVSLLVIIYPTGNCFRFQLAERLTSCHTESENPVPPTVEEERTNEPLIWTSGNCKNPVRRSMFVLFNWCPINGRFLINWRSGCLKFHSQGCEFWANLMLRLNFALEGINDAAFLTSEDD